MQSNKKTRIPNGRTLAAGFAGLLVGAAVIGFLPSASQELLGQAEPDAPDANTLELRLTFVKGIPATELFLIDCDAFEDGEERPCTRRQGPGIPFNHPGGSRDIDTKSGLPGPPTAVGSVRGRGHFDWTGKRGSGCATVGGVRYCW